MFKRDGEDFKTKFSKNLKIVILFSFFEKYMFNYYNTLVIIDADGSVINVYRKIHIPEGMGYEEKFYFKSGNTQFILSETKFGKIY